MQVSEHNSIPDSEMSSVQPVSLTQQLSFTLPFVQSQKLTKVPFFFLPFLSSNSRPYPTPPSGMGGVSEQLCGPLLLAGLKQLHIPYDANSDIKAK